MTLIRYPRTMAPPPEPTPIPPWRLYAIRERLGMTRSQMADVFFDVTERVIEHWETGATPVPLEHCAVYTLLDQNLDLLLMQNPNPDWSL